MKRKGYLIVAGLFVVWLSGCTEPWLWPELSSRETQILQDGGYCRDAWGQKLSPLDCSHQSESLSREQLKAK